MPGIPPKPKRRTQDIKDYKLYEQYVSSAIIALSTALRYNNNNNNNNNDAAATAAAAAHRHHHARRPGTTTITIRELGARARFLATSRRSHKRTITLPRDVLTSLDRVIRLRERVGRTYAVADRAGHACHIERLRAIRTVLCESGIFQTSSSSSSRPRGARGKKGGRRSRRAAHLGRILARLGPWVLWSNRFYILTGEVAEMAGV